MYSVFVQTAACGNLQSARLRPLPETKALSGPQPVAGLKPVTGAASGSPVTSQPQPQPQRIDPETLASRILDLHAASVEDIPECARRPKLANDPEHPDTTTVDMGSILGRQPPAAAGRGPSFKALLVSTAIVVAVVGGIVLPGLGALSGSGAAAHIAETPGLAPEPATEGLSAGAGPGERSTRNVTGTGAGTPSPAQIASAKDRIRDVFATLPLSRSDTQIDRPAARQEEKIQARLSLPQPTRGAALSARVVRASAEPADDAGALPAAQTTLLASAQREPEAEAPTDLPPQSGAPVSGGYPQSGRITAAVNLRQSGDKDAPVLAVVPAGAVLGYDTCGTWWCSVDYQGKRGFVGQKFLEPAQRTSLSHPGRTLLSGHR